MPMVDNTFSTLLEINCLKMIKFLLLTTILGAVVLGDPIPETSVKNETALSRSRRIIGGVKVEITEVPWQVGIGIATITRGRLAYEHFCGGSIISEIWVLTAAHCLVDAQNWYEPRGINVVRSGSAQNNNGGSGHDVAFYRVHESYDQYFHGALINDIGVIYVTQKFEFDRTRQPIALYNRSSVTYSNLEANMTGWGSKTRKEKPTYAHQLHLTNMEILNKTVCDNFLSQVFHRDTSEIGQICGYSHGRTSTCNGDSGGPVVLNGSLIGIVSWGGSTCGKKGHPEVFTEVAKYVTWIGAKTGVWANEQNVTLDLNELKKWEQNEKESSE